MKWLVLGAVAGFVVGELALSYVNSLASFLEGVDVGGWIAGHGWAVGAATAVVGFLAKRKGELLMGLGIGLLARWIIGVV